MKRRGVAVVDILLPGLMCGVWVTSELMEEFELYCIPALLTGPPVPGLSLSLSPESCEILLSRAVAADTGRLSGILEKPLVLRVLAWLTFRVGVVQISTWS